MAACCVVANVHTLLQNLAYRLRYSKGNLLQGCMRILHAEQAAFYTALTRIPDDSASVVVSYTSKENASHPTSLSLAQMRRENPKSISKRLCMGATAYLMTMKMTHRLECGRRTRCGSHCGLTRSFSSRSLRAKAPGVSVRLLFVISRRYCAFAAIYFICRTAPFIYMFAFP